MTFVQNVIKINLRPIKNNDIAKYQQPGVRLSLYKLYLCLSRI